jgi:hypothetical protein
MLMNRFRLLSSALLTALLTVAIAWPAAAQDAGLDLQLRFSTDGGQTWSEQPPVVEPGGSFLLEGSWEITDPDVEPNATIVALLGERNFASANRGRKRDYGGGFIQQPRPYWVNANRSRVRMEVDLGARAEGTTGYRNSWQQGRFVDTRLGAVEPLPAGVHEFTFVANLRGGPQVRATFPVRVGTRDADATPVGEVTSVQQRDDRPARPIDIEGRAESAGHAIHMAPDGQDHNDGASGSPVATLERALSLAGPGDTVIIHDGEYRLTRGIRVMHNGAAEEPFIIRAADDAQPILKGSQPVEGWQQHAEGVYRADWPTNSQMVFADGRPLTQIGGTSGWHGREVWQGQPALRAARGGVDDLIDDSFHYDTDASVLYVRLAEGRDPSDILIEAGVSGGLLRLMGDGHQVVRGLTLMHTNGSVAGGRPSVLSLGGDNKTVEDCTLAFGDFKGLGIIGHNHTIRNTRIEGNGCVGIEINGSSDEHNWSFPGDRPSQNIVIEGCEVIGNNVRNFYPAWHAGGIKAVTGVRGVTIRDSTFAHNLGHGVWFDHVHGGILIEHNRIHHNRSGIFFEISRPLPGDPYSMLARHNFIYRNDNQGVYISASQQTRVEHNTIFGNNFDLVYHGMPRGTQELRDNTATRNILCGRAVDVVVYQGEGAGGNSVHRNFYAMVASDGVEDPIIYSLPNGRGYSNRISNLSRIQSAFGLAEGAISGEPRWADPDGGNFQTRGPSPADGYGAQPRD